MLNVDVSSPPCYFFNANGFCFIVQDVLTPSILSGLGSFNLAGAKIDVAPQADY